MAEQLPITGTENKDKSKTWLEQARYSDSSIDPTRVKAGYQDLVALSFKMGDDIEKAILFSEDKNYGLALMGKDEFTEKYSKRFAEPEKAYKVFESAFNIYNSNRNIQPVQQSIETIRFDGTRPDFDKFTRIATEQQVASTNNYFEDKNGNYKPFKYKSDYNNLKKSYDADGYPIWKEAQDNELIKAGNILSFNGPQKLESKNAGSFLRGLWAGSLPTIAKGIAGAELLTGAISDKITGTANEDYRDKQYYKDYVKLMNWANYNTHTNEDEGLGFLSDFNSAVNMVGNGTSQMIGIFASSGITALGLKAVGKIGVNIADKTVMNISQTVATLFGSMEAVGPISQEMIEAGFTPKEAAIPLAIAGGITYLSERLLGMNISQKLGASMVLNRYMGEVGEKDIQLAIKETIGRELRRKGVKSVSELDEGAKKELKNKIIDTFSKIRVTKMGKLLEDINAKKVVLSSLEEGAEEYIEAGGDVVLFKWLNNLNQAKAQTFVNEDQSLKWEMNQDGSYNVTDVRTNESNNVSRNYKEEYDRYKGLTLGIVSGDVGMDESVSIDDGLAAFFATLLTLSVGAGTGIINHKAQKKTASGIAMYLAENPNKIEEYKKNMASVISKSSPLDAELAKQVDKDVERYMLLIEKYGLNSQTTQSAIGSNKSLAKQLLEKYDNLESLKQLENKSKEDGFDWSKQTGIKSEKELIDAIDASKKGIEYYTKTKPQPLTDRNGATIKAEYSQAFTDMYNEDASYEFYKKDWANKLSEQQARNFNKDLEDGLSESEYDKKKQEFYNNEIKRFDDNFAKGKLININGIKLFAKSINELYSVLPKDQRQNIWNNNSNSTIATRYIESLNNALDIVINSAVDKNYDISGLKGLNERMNVFLKESEGLDVLGRESKIEEVFGAKGFLPLVDLISKEISSAKKMPFDMRAGDIVSKEIDALEANVKKIYAMAEMSEESAFDDIFKDGKLTSITGFQEKELKDLNEKELSDVKAKALELSLDRLKFGDKTFKGFIDEITDILNGDNTITQDKAKAIQIRLDFARGIIEDYSTYIALQDYFKEIDKDKKTREHSKFSENRQLELDNISEVNKKLKGYNNSILSMQQKVDETLGTQWMRGIKTELSHLSINYAVLDNVIIHFSKDLPADKLTEINKIFDEFKALENTIKEKLPKDTKSISLFDDLYAISDAINNDETAEKEVEDLLLNINKLFVKFYDQLGSGTLDKVIAKIQEKALGHALTENHALELGAVIDHTDTGLTGFFSAETINEGFKYLIEGKISENDISNPNKALTLVRFMASGFLTRMNNYGNNGKHTYRQILKAYSRAVSLRAMMFNPQPDGKGGMNLDSSFEDQNYHLFASSFEQSQVVMHALGFIENFAGDNKFGKVEGPKNAANVLNIRGYAGAGKTQQIVFDILLTNSLLKGDKAKVKYVGPNLEIQEVFKKSTIDYISQFGIEFTSLSTDEYLVEGKKDDANYDIVIIDEASIVPRVEYSTNQRVGNFTSNIKANPNVAYLFLSDDSQIADKNMVSEINIYDASFEKTVPVVETYRSGINQFKLFLNSIRRRRQQGLPFQYSELSYYIDENGNRFGGQHFQHEQALVSEFVKYVQEGNITDIKDAVLVVFDEDVKKRIIDTYHLEDKKDLIRTLSFENNKEVVSGLSSRAVFLNIDKDTIYFPEGKGDTYDKHYFPKMALTGISRAKKYLAMIGPDFTKEAETKMVAEETSDMNSSEAATMRYNSIVKLTFKLNELAGLEDEQEKQEKPSVETSENILRQGDIKESRIAGDKKRQLQNVLDKLNAENIGKVQAEKMVSELLFDIIKGDINEKSDENRKRKEIFRFIAKSRANSRMAILQTISALDSKLANDINYVENITEVLDTELNEKYSKELQVLLQEYEDIKRKEGEERVVITLPQAKEQYLELSKMPLPPEVENGDARIVVEPSISNSKMRGKPYMLKLAGWDVVDGKTVPIVDIVEIQFSGEKLSPYTMAKLLAYVKILNDNNILVNQIRVTKMNASKGIWSFEYQGMDTMTVEDLITGIGEDNILGTSLEDSETNPYEAIKDTTGLSSVTLEQLFTQERSIPSIGEINRERRVKLANEKDKYNVDDITINFNGKKMVYRLYLSDDNGNTKIVYANETDKLLEKANVYNAEMGLLFEENPLLFHNENPEEITATSYFPYYDGILEHINPNNAYDKKFKKNENSKNIADIRRKVIDYAKKNGVNALRYVYRETYEVLAIRAGVLQSKEKDIFDHVLTLEFKQEHLEDIVVQLQLEGITTVDEFKRLGLNVLALANPIDIAFKNDSRISQTLFDRDNLTINKESITAANEIFTEFNNESFDEFKGKFKDKLNTIFGNTFIGDKHRELIVNYNIFKLYRIAFAKKNKSIDINMISDTASAKRNYPQKGIVWVPNNGKIEVSELLKNMELEGYELAAEKFHPTGTPYLIFKNSFGEEFHVNFYADDANEIYYDSLQNELNELEKELNQQGGLLSKDNTLSVSEKRKAVSAALRETEAFQFFFSNKSRISDDRTGVSVLNNKYAQIFKLSVFDPLKSTNQVLLLKGNHDSMISNLRSALNLARQEMNDPSVKFIKSTNEKQFQLKHENGKVKIKGVANPYIITDPNFNDIGIGIKTKIVPNVNDDFDFLDFDSNANYPWRDATSIILVDSLENVQQAVEDILGLNGLAITDFKTSIDPAILGRLKDLHISLLRQGNKASVKVARHEAMHFIINHLIAPESAARLLNEARNEMSRRGITILDDIAVQEWVADMFMDGNYNTLPQESLIKRFINWLRKVLPFLNANEDTLRDIMYQADNGAFKNADIRNTTPITLDVKIENEHTNIDAVQNISRYFKTVDNARAILYRGVLIPVLQNHSFLSNDLKGGALTVFDALNSYAKNASEVYAKNEAKFKEGISYPVYDNGVLKTEKMAFKDIFNDKFDKSQIIDDALNAYTKDGLYSKKAETFLRTYLFILLFSPNKNNKVNSKLARDLFQLIFPGIDIQVQYEKKDAGEDGEASAVAASYIFRNPNQDPGSYDPNETRSTVYDMFFSIIPNLHSGDKSQQSYGYINPKVIFNELSNVTTDLINKGNINPTWEQILTELKETNNESSLSKRNTVYSFLKVIIGDVDVNDINDDFFIPDTKTNTIPISYKVESDKTSTTKHLGFNIFNNEAFIAKVNKIEDDAVREAILEKGKQITRFLSGLKMHIRSLSNNEIGKIEVGGIIQTKRISKLNKTLNDTVIKQEMNNRLLIKDGSRLKTNVSEYIKNTELGIGTDNFLYVKGSSSSLMASSVIKKVLGVDIDSEYLKVLFKDKQRFAQFHNFMKDVRKMQKDSGVVIDLFKDHSDILNTLVGVSSISHSIRIGEMVRNVEGKSTYTKTLGSYYSSNFLGSTTGLSESITDRMSNSFLAEIGDSKMTPLSATTNLILQKKLQLIDIFTLNGVTTKTKGTKFSNLNNFDKYYLMKNLLMEGVTNGVNDLFAYSDPIADKSKMPLFTFNLNRTESENIFNYSNYTLSVNEANLFDVMKTLIDYDNRVNEVNLHRFRTTVKDDRIVKIAIESDGGKAVVKNLIENVQYYKEGDYLYPTKSKGLNGGATSMNKLRLQHKDSMIRYAKEVASTLSEESLFSFLKYEDVSSFKEFASFNELTDNAFQAIEKEDKKIAKRLKENKESNFYDKDKSYLDDKKDIIKSLGQVMLSNNLMIEKDGVVKLMPVLEMMYWTHHIANQTISSLTRGNELQTNDVIEYVKRAAGMAAPGSLMINTEYPSMASKLRVIHVNDIKDSYKLFDSKEVIDATDGNSILNPIHHVIMRRMNGGLATNVSKGSLKNVYYNFDKANDRVDYHKYNQFTVGETEYKNSKFYQSWVRVSLGGEQSILYKKFLKEYNKDRDYNAAIEAVADYLETNEGQLHKEELIHYAVFKSAVKQGKSNINTLKGETVYDAEFTDDMLDNIIELDPMGYRMQQITTQNSFNSKTSVPSQLLNVVSVLQQNKDVASGIETALDFFSEDIRKELNKILYSKSKPLDKILERKKWMRDILLEYALKNQSSDKATTLITEKDVDFDVIRDKVIQVLSSKVKNSMNGTMPGAYHIQGVWFGSLYVNKDTGQLILPEDYDAITDEVEKEKYASQRELAPQGYIKEDGSEVTERSELDGEESTIIKEGVSELFESNPELANAVYEALGFKSFDTKGVSLDTKERDGWKWIKLNGKNIGEVKLIKNDRKSKEVGLSIKLDEEYQNKGYGQIVHTLVADWAKNKFGDTLYSDFYNSQAEINTLLALTKKGYAEQIGNYGAQEDGRYSTDVRAFRIKTSNEIGTINPQQKQQAQQLYSQYLDTIFPNNAIFYHSTILPFEEFDSNKTTMMSKDMGEGFYISDKKNSETWGKYQENNRARIENLYQEKWAERELKKITNTEVDFHYAIYRLSDEKAIYKILSENRLFFVKGTKLNDFYEKFVSEFKESYIFEKPRGYDNLGKGDQERVLTNFRDREFEKQLSKKIMEEYNIEPYIGPSLSEKSINLPVLVNTNNSLIVDDAYLASSEYDYQLYDVVLEKGSDGITQGVIYDYKKNSRVLGTKIDIERFKKFINKKSKSEDNIEQQKQQAYDDNAQKDIKYKFRKAEVIAPFIYANKFGIKKGMTLHQAFTFGNTNLYSITGEITYKEILTSLEEQVGDVLTMEGLDEFMPTSMRMKFQSMVSRIINDQNEAIDKMTPAQIANKDKKETTKKNPKTLSRSSILKRLAMYYLNLNRSMDMFTVRIPTTGASMGSPGRLVAFGWGVENTAYLSPKKNILDGSDYDADQLNIFYRAIDNYLKVVDSETFETEQKVKTKNSKGEEVEKTVNPSKLNDAKIKDRNPIEYHQNLIFNSLYKYYNNIQNASYVLQRINLQPMRDVGNKNIIEQYHYNQGSAMKAHEDNSSGTKLVGHFANFTTFINNISRSSRFDEVRQYLDGITDIFKNDDLFLEITRINTVLVNAGTDNANEGGLLGRLGITEATSPLVSGFLFKYSKRVSDKAYTSVSNDNIELGLYEYMDKPIVKEIARRVKNKNTYWNIYPTTAIKEAMLLKANDEFTDDDIQEAIEYSKVGEQLKRMGKVIQAYRDPGYSLETIHTTIFDVQNALGTDLKKYISKVKNYTSETDFDTAEQTKYVKANLKSTQELKNETEIRESLNIPFVLSRLNNITSQLDTINAFSELTNSLFSITNFKFRGKFGLDAYEEFITKQKGNRSEENLKRFYQEMEKALTGVYLDKFTDVDMPILKESYTYETDENGNEIATKHREVITNNYNLSKIAASESGRLKFVKDFPYYIDALKNSHDYSTNDFLGAVRTRTMTNYRQVGIEELSSQTETVIRQLRTGFYHLKEDDKKLFRLYQLLNEGFYNYRGSMNLVMDNENEKKYSLFLRKLDLSDAQKLKMLTNVAHISLLGLKENNNVIDRDNNIKEDFDAEIGYVDRVSVFDEVTGRSKIEKLGYPTVFRKTNGEYVVSTMEYANPFNVYSNVSDAAYPGKFLSVLSFNDIEEMVKTKSYTVTESKNNFLPVSYRTSEKTYAMPVDGDITVLMDGSRARIEVTGNKGVKRLKVIPLETSVESTLEFKELRSTAKKLEVFIDKIQTAFPNIKIEIINDASLPIGFIGKDGIVYINDAKVQYDTPLHEVGHIFLKLLQRTNNKAYNTLKAEVESLLLSNNEIAKAVERKYPELKHDDLVMEIITTIMGINTASRVQELLALDNQSQNKAADVYKGLRGLIRKIWNWISKSLSSMFNTQLNIANGTTIEELGDIFFDKITSGEKISNISTAELIKLLPQGSQSKGLTTINKVSDLFSALAKNNLSDEANLDSDVLRLQQEISNNKNTLNESFLGRERVFVGNIYSAENTEEIKKVIRESKEYKKTIQEKFHKHLLEGGHYSKVGNIFGMEKVAGEMESIYDPVGVTRVANAVKYDGHGEIMFYSDLKNHPKWAKLYDDRFNTEDFTIIIRDVNGKPIIQMYSFFNHSITRFDHYSKGIGLFENFVDKRTASKEGLDLGNTESTRNDLQMMLLRNHFHSVGANVSEIGRIDFLKKDSNFHYTEQLRLTEQLNIIAGLPQFTDKLSDSFKKLLSKDVNYNDHVDHVKMLISFYKYRLNTGADNNRYISMIHSIVDRDGNFNTFDMIKLLQYRRNFLLSLNPEHKIENYNRNDFRELEFLTRALAELEFMGHISTNLNPKTPLSDIGLYFGPIDTLGNDNIRHIKKTLIKSHNLVIERYKDQMSKFKEAPKGEDSIFQWFEKRYNNRVLQGFFDKTEIMFEDLHVKVQDVNNNEVNTGHVFWTTDETLDPLYAKLAKEKLRNDSTFQGVIDRGEVFTQHIEDMLISYMIESRRKKNLFIQDATGRKVYYDKLQAKEDLKKTSYRRGMIPVMNKKSASYFASGNIGKALNKLYQEVSNVDEMYDDIVYKSRDVIKENNEIRDLFAGNMGLFKQSENAYGDLYRLEHELGYTIKDGNIQLFDAKKNSGMMKDMETLMNYFTMSILRKNEYELSVLPLVNSVRMLMMDDMVNRNINNENNIKFVEGHKKQAIDNMRVKTFGEILNIDIDKTTSFTMKMGAAAVMTLNFNIGILSATANAAYSYIEGLSNSISKKLGVEVFGPGMTHLLSSSMTFFTDYNKTSQLAYQYKVFSSQDYEMMQHRIHQQTKHHIFSTFYINWVNWATDVYARSTTMASVMKNEGVWDAFEYDKDTQKVKYNPLNDKRFFKDGKLTKEGEVLLRALVERLRSQGLQDDKNAIMYGDITLPTRAYDIWEESKFKAYADRFVIGYQDKKSQPIFGNMLLGRVFGMFKTFMINRLNNAFMPLAEVEGAGKYIAVIEDHDGTEVMVAHWENEMVEGFINTTFKTLSHLVKHRDLSVFSKLKSHEKRNLVKMGVNLSATIFMFLMYNLLVAKDWDDDDIDKPLLEGGKIAPYRMVKNWLYTYQSILAIPLLYDAIKNPFAIVDISTGMFTNVYGKFDITKGPFSAQARAGREAYEMLTGQDSRQIRADAIKEKAAQTRLENELKNNQ